MRTTLKHFLINEWPGVVAAILYFILSCGCAWLIVDNRRVAKESSIREIQIQNEISINRAIGDKILKRLDELLKK